MMHAQAQGAMAAIPPDQENIVEDASWLAHRYDPVGDKVHFVRAPRETHRAATFLTDEFLPEATRPRPVGRRAALDSAPPAGPIHFIFHSAYCCSTLLARAFDIENVSMGLKEPVILNDLSGWRRRGGPPAQIAEALNGTLTLLARPFVPGEAVIVKPSNVVNALAPSMLALRPDANALLLYAPLRLYLASIAKKGMWGRLWVRDLFVKLTKDGLADYGFTPEEILGQTDLQIAAIGWLAQHRLFAALIDRYGSERIRTLDSETLLAQPTRTMQHLAALYRFPLGKTEIADIVAGDAFTQHSKGIGAFDREARRAEQRDAAQVHAEEVDKVAAWAETVASSASQPLELGVSLFD